MFQVQDLAIDHLKDVPGFKGLLKAVLKSQIQLLIEQLAKHTDEESIVLSASVSDGALSYLSSDTARDFLEEKEDLKSQFLRFCLKKHHRKECGEREAAQHTSSLETQESPADMRTNHRRDCDDYCQTDAYHVKRPRVNNPVSLRNKFHQNRLEPPSLYSKQDVWKGDRFDNHSPGVGISGYSNSDTQQDSVGKQPETLQSDQELQVKIKTEPSSDLDDVVKEKLDGEILQVSSVCRNNTSVFPARVIVPSAWGESTLNSSDFSESPVSLDNGRLMQQFGQLFPSISSSPGSPASALNLMMSSEKKPQVKKRVYRKVECEFCNKLVYITNIKVHRFRHLQQLQDSGMG